LRINRAFRAALHFTGSSMILPDLLLLFTKTSSIKTLRVPTNTVFGKVVLLFWESGTRFWTAHLV